MLALLLQSDQKESEKCVLKRKKDETTSSIMKQNLVDSLSIFDFGSQFLIFTLLI